MRKSKTRETVSHFRAFELTARAGLASPIPRSGPTSSRKLIVHPVRPNAGAFTNTSLCFRGFHENVYFLQILESLPLGLQGVHASDNRCVLAWRGDLQMLGEA